MELFVINRHGEEKPEGTEEKEKEKLDRVLKQIERKRQQRIRQREREREKKQHAKKFKANSSETPTPIDSTETAKETSQESSKKRKVNPAESFTVLGAETAAAKPKIDRVLPQWLAQPTKISSNLQELTVKVSKLKQLDKNLRARLKSNGVSYFFPVQGEVIPFLLKSHRLRDIMVAQDVCVCAPTGSGKTLAFVLPIIQALAQHTTRKIRALVILPTQDLADQVYRNFKLYSQGTSIEIGLATGKHLLEVEQKQLLYFNESFGYVSKADILVCTAGRLVNHMKVTKGFDLKSLEFLVIDEADRVLENVQDDWLYHLEKHLNSENYTVHNRKVLNLRSLHGQKSPQKLLFSATLTQDPEKIEKLSLFQPKLFTTEEPKSSLKYTTPNELTEKYISCTKDVKPLVLYSFLKHEHLTRTLIFTHSVETTHRLKVLLKSLFKSRRKIEEVSSNLKGKDRQLLIDSFSKGEIDILICTDSLARGIDLPNVKCVISYSAPKYLKTYIHRAGRTARAGEMGLAVTILHEEQLAAFKSLIKKEIEQVQVDEEDLERKSEKYRKALEKLKETVDKEEDDRLKTLISRKKVKTKVKKVA